MFYFVHKLNKIFYFLKFHIIYIQLYFVMHLPTLFFFYTKDILKTYQCIVSESVSISELVLHRAELTQMYI